MAHDLFVSFSVLEPCLTAGLLYRKIGACSLSTGLRTLPYCRAIVLIGKAIESALDVLEPCLTAGLLYSYEEACKEALRLRTLPYCRAIVLNDYVPEKFFGLRTLPYCRAIVLRW